jgi:hypothetical protein
MYMSKDHIVSCFYASSTSLELQLKYDKNPAMDSCYVKLSEISTTPLSRQTDNTVLSFTHNNIRHVRQNQS